MKTTISDFSFSFSGYGHYRVIYKSPITSKEWTTLVTDMTIIDATKNSDQPKMVDLERLKRLCKR